MTDKIVVFSTCKSHEEAAKVARHLVEKRVAVCVTLAPGAESIYHWQGRVESAAECLLIIKSSRERFAALKIELQKVHSYQVPEIVAVPIVDGSEAYIAWMDRELGEQPE